MNSDLSHNKLARVPDGSTLPDTIKDLRLHHNKLEEINQNMVSLLRGSRYTVFVESNTNSLQKRFY